VLCFLGRNLEAGFIPCCYVPPTITNVVVTGLSSGVRYRFRVVALSTIGGTASPPSPWVTTPESLRAAAGMHETKHLGARTPDNDDAVVERSAGRDTGHATLAPFTSGTTPRFEDGQVHGTAGIRCFSTARRCALFSILVCPVRGIDFHFCLGVSSASLPTSMPPGKPKGVYGNRIAALAPIRAPKPKKGDPEPVFDDDGFGYPVGGTFTWEMPPDGDFDTSAHPQDFSVLPYGLEDAKLAAELAAAEAKPVDDSIIHYGLGEHGGCVPFL
jgi:hypothetical protein